jgi:hypothetical protein
MNKTMDNVQLEKSFISNFFFKLVTDSARRLHVVVPVFNFSTQNCSDSTVTVLDTPILCCSALSVVIQHVGINLAQTYRLVPIFILAFHSPLEVSVEMAKEKVMQRLH